MTPTAKVARAKSKKPAKGPPTSVEGNAAQQDELISLLADGLPLSAIAEIMGVHRVTVWTRSKKLPCGAVEAELARRRMTFDEARADYIRRAHALGWSIAEGRAKIQDADQRDWLMYYTGRTDIRPASAPAIRDAAAIEDGAPADSTKIPAGAQVVIQYNGPGPALPMADVGREPQANDPDDLEPEYERL